MLRKHASHISSSVVHDNVKVKMVTQYVSVGGDTQDSAPVEGAVIRTPAGLRQRCGVAACTIGAAKKTLDVSIRGDRHDSLPASKATTRGGCLHSDGQEGYAAKAYPRSRHDSTLLSVPSLDHARG